MVAAVISLIGMSNVGKSHWARRLAREAGYQHIDCDLLIAHALFPDPAERPSLRGMASWLGQPGDVRYAERSLRLLAAEREVMLELMRDLEAEPGGDPRVLDTSGSVIHAGDDVLAALQQHTRVVYLEAPASQLAALYARYLAQPKPLIWGDTWEPRDGESVAAARARCYPALLADRARRYAALAHVTVTAGQRRLNLQSFLGA